MFGGNAFGEIDFEQAALGPFADKAEAVQITHATAWAEAMAVAVIKAPLSMPVVERMAGFTARM